MPTSPEQTAKETPAFFRLWRVRLDVLLH